MIKLMVSQWSHLVGALLSLPCLLLIILIYCLGFSFIRMPRKSKHSLINILLLITSTITLFTISLTLPNTSPSSGSSLVNNHHCLISSTLVNFSTISCLLWMFLSAISMYQSLTHSVHEITSTINSTSTSSSSNNNNCTKTSSTDDNNEDEVDVDEIEPENEPNDEDEDDDDNLKIPADLPLQSRSSYHHQYHPTATLSSFSGSGKKSTSSVLTIVSYYLFAYGLSTIICISCLLINTNNINTGSSIYTSPPPWNLLKSTSTPPSLSSCYYHVTLMTPTGYAITYGPIALLFCLNLIVYLIVAFILSCLGTNIVSPKGSTLHHQRYHSSHDHHESSTIKPHHGLTHTDGVGNQSIKVDLEWTYRRQLFAQIGLFILFTNLIVSMIFLVSWRPFSFVNHHSTSHSASSSSAAFPIAEASISSATINGSIISSSTTTIANSDVSNFTESIPLMILSNSSTSHLIPLASAASSSSSSSPTTTHSSYLPSSPTNINAFQMDQLFYGSIYSLSTFLIASYLMILYVARRSDVRTLLTYWLKGSNGGRRYNQYNNHRSNGNSETNRGSKWFNCCCFTGSVRESPLMPKVDVIRSSNSHSSQSTDHHLFSTTTNYHHHHLAQALLQSAHETSTLTSSSSLVNAKLLLNNIDDTATINGKELAHGLVYEEIKSTHNDSLINLNSSSRIASIHSINKSNNSKLINNISSNCQSTKQKLNYRQPSLIESTSSTPLITIDSNLGSSSQVNYHLNYTEANHEVFINPKLNAIAKKFFEKNRRKQQQLQHQQLTNYNDKNDLNSKDIQSIARSTSSFRSETSHVNHHIPHHPLTTSIFSNRPRLSFDNGYAPNGYPKGQHHHHKGSASVVGVPMSRSSGFTSEIGDLISRLHPPTSSSGKTGFPPPPSVITQPLPPLPPSSSLLTGHGPSQGPTKAKSDIVCWSPSPSFLAKWQGPRTNPPPLPPLPTRKELMSTGRQQPQSPISTVMVGTPRRPNLSQSTGKDGNNSLQDENHELTSGLRVKLSNRKRPPSPSSLHKSLVKSSSSIPGALDDRDNADQAASEILSVCCGSEVMSTVSVPWSCYSKRTAPPFLSTTNTGPGDSHLHGASSTGSSSCHRYHCHSHSQSHSHRHHHRSNHSNKRSTSRSHHRSNHHCNRCWDVYFCDICDHCTAKTSSPSSNRRRDEAIVRREEKDVEGTGNKEHLVGHLPIRSSNLPRDHHHSHRNNHVHGHHHNSPTITTSAVGNSSPLNKKDSPHDVNTPSSNPESIAVITGFESSSNLSCYPRKPGSTVSSNGVERRRRRRRKSSSQCKNRSSQGSTGSGHHHHRGPCKHLPRSTSVTEYRSCHCYNDKHQQYSSSDSQ